MALVGVISRTIDKMPRWAQVILMAFGLAVFVYGIAHYGWSFFWKMLFSPDL
jgi:uncharacterized membrane protein